MTFNTPKIGTTAPSTTGYYQKNNMEMAKEAIQNDKNLQCVIKDYEIKNHEELKLLEEFAFKNAANRIVYKNEDFNMVANNIFAEELGLTNEGICKKLASEVTSLFFESHTSPNLGQRIEDEIRAGGNLKEVIDRYSYLETDNFPEFIRKSAFNGFLFGEDRKNQEPTNIIKMLSFLRSSNLASDKIIYESLKKKLIDEAEQSIKKGTTTPQEAINLFAITDRESQDSLREFSRGYIYSDINNQQLIKSKQELIDLIERQCTNIPNIFEELNTLFLGNFELLGINNFAYYSDLKKGVIDFLTKEQYLENNAITILVSIFKNIDDHFILLSEANNLIYINKLRIANFEKILSQRDEGNYNYHDKIGRDLNDLKLFFYEDKKIEREYIFRDIFFEGINEANNNIKQLIHNCYKIFLTELSELHSKIQRSETTSSSDNKEVSFEEKLEVILDNQKKAIKEAEQLVYQSSMKYSSLFLSKNVHKDTDIGDFIQSYSLHKFLLYTRIKFNFLTQFLVNSLILVKKSLNQ